MGGRALPSISSGTCALQKGKGVPRRGSAWAVEEGNPHTPNKRKEIWRPLPCEKRGASSRARRKKKEKEDWVVRTRSREAIFFPSKGLLSILRPPIVDKGGAHYVGRKVSSHHRVKTHFSIR